MNSIIRTILKVVAVLLFVSGGVWFLQGVNILPGSFMTGDPQWAVNGGMMMIAAAGLFWVANRK
jgi:hypothetical protein